MDAVETEDVRRNLDRQREGIEQILPTLIDEDTGEAAEARGDIVLERLRREIRRLAEALAALDKRDAGQHGGLKGELAHVNRRIARLEATPRTRHAR
jgi:hypothetical protein